MRNNLIPRESAAMMSGDWLFMFGISASRHGLGQDRVNEGMVDGCMVDVACMVSV